MKAAVWWPPLHSSAAISLLLSGHRPRERDCNQPSWKPGTGSKKTRTNQEPGSKISGGEIAEPRRNELTHTICSGLKLSGKVGEREREQEERKSKAGGQNGACVPSEGRSHTHTHTRRQQVLQPVMCIYPPAGSSQCGMASTATKPTRQPTTTTPPQGQRPNIFPRRGRESLSSLASPP